MHFIFEEGVERRNIRNLYLSSNLCFFYLYLLCCWRGHL